MTNEHTIDSEIETLRKQIQKRQTLFLTLSMLDQLPPAAPDLPPACVTPGAVAGGANHMEMHA